MMPASKHGDPQMGVDVHLCTVPPGVPAPLPTPHTSIVFDPFDYVPILGATVTVCGMKRATAGTGATTIHIPPGFPFAPKLPDKDDELFMGSSTVVADGDPFSYVAVPVLGCQIAGMISPPRPKKKGSPKAMVLPTSVNLAIPTNVVVGGAPTISLMGMAMKGAFSALGKFAKSGLFKRMRQKMFKNMNPGFLKCKVLRAEPVNILNGSVSVEQQDFTLPGRIPIEWNRTYSSNNKQQGLCGYGWETPADIRLEIEQTDGTVSLIHPSMGPLIFEKAPREQGKEFSELELMDGALLSDEGDEFTVQTKEDRIYRFQKSRKQINPAGNTEYAISSIYDLCGNYLQYEYSGNRLSAINESAGRRIELVSENDRIIEVALWVPDVDKRHVFCRYEYDQTGDLVAVYDALDNPYTFEYDHHHMVRHTDRNGLSFYYEFEQGPENDWRVFHSWGDGGLYNYQFEYFDELNERRITDSLGHVSTVILNEAGLPICEIDPLDGMTQFEYDDAGRTTAVVDPDQHKIEFTYDKCGNLIELIRPDGLSIFNVYNENNELLKSIDPRGNEWQQNWDSFGLLCWQETPVGGVTKYFYNNSGDLVQVIDPLGNSTDFIFDSYGNPVKVINALNSITQYKTDILGNVIAVVDPIGAVTRYFYDKKARLIERTDPNAQSISARYDAEDNPIEYCDEAGHVTTLCYFGIGQVSKRLNADGTYVQYQYDTEENLIRIKNECGQICKISYDPLGNVIGEVDYWGSRRSYLRNAVGNLISSIDSLGHKTDYELDQLGRIITKIYFNGMREKFEYDENSNLVTTENENIRIERIFDANNQLLVEKQGDFSVLNEYDLIGNRVRRVSPKGNEVIYKFDKIGNAIEIKINHGEPIRIARDCRGLVVHESLSHKVNREFQYDSVGNMINQNLQVGDQTLVSRNYQYDVANNLLKKNDSNKGEISFQYDSMGRIVEQFNPENNLQKFFRTLTGDLLQPVDVPETKNKTNDRLGQYKGTIYHFDKLGNLIERNSNEEKRTTFKWGCNNYLVEANSNGNSTNMGYDPQARRIFKETNGVLTQFIWDGNFLLSETSEDNGFREYIFYPGSFEPLAIIEADKTIFYYQNDVIGLPHEICDTNGEIVWSATYQAHGCVDSLIIDKLRNPIRLRGQYYDDEIELCYSRYRFYDPNLGSFVSQDPLGLVAGLNPYQYAPNVWVWSDPFGLACKNTPGTGVVYLRTNPKTGKKYVGKSKSKEAFKKRKKAHDRKLKKTTKDPNAEYEFELLEDGIDGVNDPKALSKVEEDWIRCGDGPGALENKRFEMADHNYPGDIPKP